MRPTFVFLLPLIALLFSPLVKADDQADPGDAVRAKEWTFLIYLNGNNSLDEFGPINLKQMEKVGSTDSINIVVQWASLEANSTRRLLVKKSTDPEKVTSPIIQDLGQVDMGVPETFLDFVKWGVAHYPAKHYFVDIWNHGGGWHIMGNQIRPKDISWDDNSGHVITTEQLGVAMTQVAKIIGHKVDLYGSDACLMGMIEVADEMADSVNVFVGSEKTEPGAGWPYDTILQKWAAKPASTANDVAKLVVDEYIKSYEGGENGTEDATMSAYDVTKIAPALAEIKKLSAKIMTLNSSMRKKVLNAANTAQEFDSPDYKDLEDFLAKATAAKITGFEAATLKPLYDALGQFVIGNGATPNYAPSKGVAIWIPTNSSDYSQYSSRYNGLKFQADTQWGSVLKLLNQ